MGSSFDRTCHELGEESHIGKEGDWVLGWLHLTAIHIDGVAHRLKGVEADPHRENQVERTGMSLESDKVDKLSSRLDKEIEVFEESKEAEVEDEAEGEVEILTLKRFEDGRPRHGGQAKMGDRSNVRCLMSDVRCVIVIAKAGQTFRLSMFITSLKQSFRFFGDCFVVPDIRTGQAVPPLRNDGP